MGQDCVRSSSCAQDVPKILMQASACMQTPESKEDNGVVRAFATSLQLLPSLLGFPIALTRPDSILAAPGAAPDPGQEPRPEQLSYKGAMLDGLQASRMLHNEQAPGKHAASWQGQLRAPLPQAGMSKPVDFHPAAFHLCGIFLAGLCARAPGLCLCILLTDCQGTCTGRSRDVARTAADAFVYFSC